jgi:hypothetical protein
MTYRLTLTEQEIETIAFVGNRYCWAEALAGLDVGENILAEHEAWRIVDAFDADTEGGHSYFPMLDPRSALADKLVKLIGEIT